MHGAIPRTGRRLGVVVDDGDVPYHLTLMATEVFPTGVIRVIFAPTAAPVPAGYDDVKDLDPDGA